MLCLKCNEPFKPSQFSAFLCGAHNHPNTRETIIHRMLRDLAQGYAGTWAVVVIRRSGVSGSQGLFWVFEPVVHDPLVFGVYVEKDCRPVLETLGHKYPHHRSRKHFEKERDGDSLYHIINPKRRSFREQAHPLHAELNAMLTKINPNGSNSLLVFSEYYDYICEVSQTVS